MLPFDNEQVGLRPQERVFGLEELLTLILELATPKRKKHDLLAYREVGPLWGKCASKLFKKPPFRIQLCLDDMLALRKIIHVQTCIPMEVTVEKWLSKRKLAFLREFASNIVILHFVGVEGAECKVIDAPFLPKLKTLTVDRQSNVFHQESQILEFVKLIANKAPKLEVFRVILDGIQIKQLKELKKSHRGETLPEMMNCLQTKFADAHKLEKTLKNNALRNLKYANLDFDNSLNSRTISRILEQRLAHLHLKKLVINFSALNEKYYWVHPMPNLEEFISDKAIITSEPGATLSTYFPKLVILKLSGLDFISLATVTRAGSNYKHLKHLGLGHSVIMADGDIPAENSESAMRRKERVLARITQCGFGAAPNLVSLSFTGFPSSLVDVMVTELFANSKSLSKLAIQIHDLERLCDQFLLAENNSLRGTYFSRVTKLSIYPKLFETKDCSDFINGPVSIIMPELKTLKLHPRLSVDLSTRNAWKVTGRYISYIK